MNKKRRLYLLLVVFVCIVAIVLLGFAFTSRYDAPRPLLNPADSMLSVLDPGRTGFRIFHGCKATGTEVTHQVDLDELFDLLSQTTIQRSGRNHWQGTHDAEWVLWNIGRSYGDSLRGRTITLWGAEGRMIGEVGFEIQSFRLSNADEILAFLEQAVSEQ